MVCVDKFSQIGTNYMQDIITNFKIVVLLCPNSFVDYYRSQFILVLLNT